MYLSAHHWYLRCLYGFANRCRRNLGNVSVQAILFIEVKTTSCVYVCVDLCLFVCFNIVCKFVCLLFVNLFVYCVCYCVFIV